MNKVLKVVLIVAILGALGILGYVIVVPSAGERFTEYYILGEEGKAVGYPEELVVGEETKVIMGIVNHEYETMSYRVDVILNGVKHNEVGPVILADGEEWEGEVSFTPKRPGDSQKIEFFLYGNGDVEPLLEPLHLWFNVTE